jgi:hypothetical protein
VALVRVGQVLTVANATDVEAEVGLPPGGWSLEFETATGGDRVESGTVTVPPTTARIYQASPL